MAKYSNPYNIKIGDKFGEWTVMSDVKLAGAPSYKSYRLCKCSCGTTKDVLENLLVNGLSKSCGCTRRVYEDIIIGKKYGTLTVIKEVERILVNNKPNERQFLCKCDCGNIIKKGSQDLKISKNPTCKLPNHDPRMSDPNIRKFFNMANAIRVRCSTTTNNNFTSWGGRGIKCQLGHSIVDIAETISTIPGWFEGATIDRIDNDGNYTIWSNIHGVKPYMYEDPSNGKKYSAMGNLRWVSKEENNKNKSSKEWGKEDFSSRLLSRKGFMHYLRDNFRYSDFIAYKTSAKNRNKLDCFLFIHKDLKNTAEFHMAKFKKYWSDNNGELIIDETPIDVTDKFLGVKLYGVKGLSFRDGRRLKNKK